MATRKFTPWQMWLDEMMDKYDSRSPSRGLMFLRIVSEFVGQRALAKGFGMTIDLSTLRSKIATWAYVIDKEHTYDSSPQLRLSAAEQGEEFWELFERVFDDEYWNYARHRLGFADNIFGCERAAAYFWANLTYFIWRYVDINKSVAIDLHKRDEREIDEEERAFLISEGLLVEDKRPKRQDDEYYRDAGFYRGDRRYD